MNKYLFLLVLLVNLLMVSCSDDKQEPDVNDLRGTWVLTHYLYQHHYLENGVWYDDTKGEDVTPSYIPDYGYGEISGKWWDYLKFEGQIITIGLNFYPLPTCPLLADFDTDTPGGHISYEEAWDEWLNAIDEQNVEFPWVCPYSLKGDKLYVGSLYNGDVAFTSSDSFSLKYVNNDFPIKGEYERYVYTFKRNEQ